MNASLAEIPEQNNTPNLSLGDVRSFTEPNHAVDTTRQAFSEQYFVLAQENSGDRRASVPRGLEVNRAAMEGLADQVYNTMFSFGPRNNYVNYVEGMFTLSSESRNRLWELLSNTSASELNAMSEIFQRKYGGVYNTDRPQTLQQIVAGRLPEQDRPNFERLLNRREEVPENERIDGANLRTEAGQNLRVGQVNRGIQLPDGRTMDLFIPRNARQNMPLMVVLNGARFSDQLDPGATGRQIGVMERETGMNMVASDKGFAVAYVYARSPNNTGDTAWNMIGDPNNSFTNGMSTDRSYDDVNYLDNAIARVRSLVRIDNNRIGLAGFSDGARALQQYASIRSDQISSVMISSGYAFTQDRRIQTSQGEQTLPENSNIAAMIVHGTNDMMVPYDQNRRRLDGRIQGQGPYIWIARNLQGKEMPGTDYVAPWMQAENWRRANRLSQIHSTDDGRLRVTRYLDSSRQNAAPVEEYVIANGNHAWHAWQNQAGGIWFVPYTSPDRSHDFSSRFGQFLIDNPRRR